MDKIQPNCCEIEEAVIGALLLEKEAYQVVSPILKAEMFYAPKNGLIYEAVVYLIERGDPVDILTVSQFLRSKGNLAGAGGPLYISQLTNRVASSANIESHAYIIYQKWAAREVISFAGKMQNLAYDEEEDILDTIDKIEDFVKGLRSQITSVTVPHVSEALDKAHEELINRSESELGISGVPSGIYELDKLTGGFQKGKLYIIAARPGMGKSATVCTFALNQINTGYGAAVFSLEMTDRELTFRIMSQLTNIDGSVLSMQKLSQPQMFSFGQSSDYLKSKSLYIDDTAALSIQSLYTKVKKIVEKKGVKIIYVDYLQLMTVKKPKGSSMNREGEVSEISRTLKQIAKDFDIPVVALSQLSRQVESRTDKRPMLSDLRESGSIEQDSDFVGFLFRPEYYDILQDADGNSVVGLCEFDIAKHRGGKLGMVMLRFEGKFTKFTSWHDKPYSNEIETPHPDSRLTPNTSFENGEPSPF